ncbi:MAG: D-alanyl-D-alanine carboxypeptidase/D-alanyl-D-alanine-endopeptidase [Candidatus Neomarinimicrobiota bacterium]|jgi:D-alanyl-D-alanine carboxypeptidase/D-alanyl-D-alanine-endopeptidase (penicillin-binding protein 4)
MNFKRILILSFSLFLLFAQTPQELVQELAELEELNHAQWSVYARYVDQAPDEEAIISHNAEMSLACASSLKVLAVGIALDRLGANHTYKTKLYYDGIISEDGVLDGSIYILGGGDPTLGGDQVGGVMSQRKLMSTWVRAIEGAGIKKINGSIIGDESLYAPFHAPGNWSWEDLGNYYGAGFGALCYSDNKYYLDFKPGEKEGDDAEVIAIRPQIPGFKYTNRMKTGPEHSGDNGYILCAPNVYEAIFYGTVPAGNDRFTIKGSIPNPALVIAQALETSLEKKGISTENGVMVLNEKKKYNGRKLLNTVKSPPLRLIAEITNKLSNNTFTEMLLLSVADKEMGLGTTRAGIKYIYKFMDRLQVDRSGLRLVDASGLSQENMITTKIFSDYLSEMTKRESFDIFYKTFARAGDSKDFGHVQYFGDNTAAAGNARVKTGYINSVRSHTGYVSDMNGRMIAFSLIANNYHCKTKEITGIHEKIVVALANIGKEESLED